MRRASARNSIDSLLFVEHCHKLLNATRTCFLSFGVVDPVQNRVPVLAAETLEECLGLRIRLQPLLKIVWYLHIPRRGICILPPPVSFRRFNRFYSRGSHPALCAQLTYSLAVYHRPLASGSARCKPLQPESFVKRGGLPIDPPIAECDIQRVRARNGLYSCIFLSQLEPDAVRCGMVLFQPSLKVRLRGKEEDRKLFLHRLTSCVSNQVRVLLLFAA